MPAAQHCRELRNRTLVIEDQSEGVVDRETGFHSRCLMALALWRGTVGWGRKSQAHRSSDPRIPHELSVIAKLAA